MTARTLETPRLDAEPALHALSVSAVLEHLSSSRHGLAHDEATHRLERFGPNRLNVVGAESAVTILIRQFKSVVVLLLAAAAAIAMVMGDLLEGGAIAVVLLLNAVIGFVTEYRARQAMAALLALDVPRAVVLRDGQPLQSTPTPLSRAISRCCDTANTSLLTGVSSTRPISASTKRH